MDKVENEELIMVKENEMPHKKRVLSLLLNLEMEKTQDEPI